MKTKKSRVVLSSVSVLLVLSLLAGMTMAWFTDTEKVNANFTAGVLDISVKPVSYTHLDVYKRQYYGSAGQIYFPPLHDRSPGFGQDPGVQLAPGYWCLFARGGKCAQG